MDAKFQLERTRFVAEWISDMDDEGTDKSATSYHQTYEAAQAAAIAGSKKAGVIEWTGVREQQWKEDRWQTVQRWTGDWDYLELQP